METSVKITLIVVCTALILGLMGILVFNQIDTSNTINANGVATVKVTPDLVSIYFNIETKSDTASEAKDNNAEIAEEVITALVMEGLERKDITTESFSVYPEYNYHSGQRTINGYRATHRLRVQISTDDVDKIGELIDAGVDSGAGINYISYELSQELQNQYKAEALEKATEDAKIKAEAIASGLGKSLGRIVSVNSQDFGYYPWRLYESTASSSVEDAKIATTDIQPGEQDISASVSVIYKIR